MNRLFAVSRMTMLLSTAVAWLDIACNERSLFAEEPKPRNASSAPADREATLVNASDLSESGGELSKPGFVPQPGRFELKVTQGWTDVIPFGVDKKLMWMLTGGNQVGVKRDDRINLSELGMLFFSENPVLEFIACTDTTVYLHARRPGTATIRFMSQSGSKIERCELRVVVEADTSEIDKAIKSAVPQAKVKVIEFRHAALLTGTVSNAEDALLLKEIATLFYPNVVTQLKVVPSATNAAASEHNERRDGSPEPQPAPQSQPADLSTASPPTSRQPAAPPRRTPATNEAATQPIHSRHRNLPELKALHDEVRALREDVRRLSELLEKRLATRAVDPPLVESKTEQTDESPNTVLKDGMLFFTATWCGPCQQMQPVIERLKREGLPIQTVDLDRLPSLAKQYHVLSIPCCVFVANGMEVDRITGLHSEQGLRSRLKPLAAKNHPKPKLDSESELSLSLAERPLPPITMQIGQRSELLFARRIRAVEKESDATLNLIRVAGNAVMVQGKVAGVTVLHVSLEESPDVLDVIVHVTASESQAAPPKVVTFDGTKTMPQSVIVQVGSSVEAGFDDWLTRVDGFDPKLINVTATDKVRLRLEGVSEGKTSLKVTKRNGEAAFEVTVVPTPDQAAARLPVVTHRITGTETLSRLVTLIEGTDRRMKTQQPTARISIGDAQVVDVIQSSPTSHRLRALKPGLTTMTFWLAGVPEPVVVTIRVLPREAAAQSQAVKKEAEEVKNTALDPKANALNFGGVTPRNIAQEAEEELLGLSRDEESPRETTLKSLR